MNSPPKSALLDGDQARLHQLPNILAGLVEPSRVIC
jgi:hypothetical protein